LGILSQSAGGGITPTKGFVLGGVTGAGGDGTTTVRKFTFSSETWGSGSSTLPGSGTQGPSCGNQLNGYNADGSSTSIRKIIHTSETTSTLAATMSSTSLRNLAGISNTAVAGYLSISGSTSLDKLTFATEAISTVAVGLSVAPVWAQGFSNVAVAGYIMVGISAQTTVDKISWPSDTKSTLGSGLSVQRWGGAGLCNVGTTGYFGGGRNNAGTSNVTSMDYWALPADTRSSGNLSLATTSQSSISRYQTSGYICGGEQDSNTGALTTIVQKVSFPSATFSNMGNQMGTASRGAGGVSESPGN
jgi:hypothetical protein